MKLPEIEIGFNCFSNCQKLTKFTIPSSKTFIGDYAFYNCKKLVNITIPSSITSIGNHSFDGCVSLKQITIPESITAIDHFAFIGCIKLSNIIIPSSVKSIGLNSFDGCVSLKKIKIPESVKTIGDYAFKSCTELESIIIPSSVESIGDYIVSECFNLTSVSISNEVKWIGKLDFQYFESLKEFKIPSSVKIINENAFKECISLKKIEIPPSVTSIENHAFNNCKSLINVTIPSTLKSIGFDSFDGCKSLKKLTIKPFVEDFAQKIDIIVDFPTTIKVITLGDSAVGKTSIIKRYVEDQFGNITPTIGVDYKSKSFEFDGENINLKIFDTPGDEKFTSVNYFYSHDVHGAIIVFDLSNPVTLICAKKWLNEIKVNSLSKPTVLLGNKSELDHQVSIEDIRRIETNYNTKYFEVSARDNSNIDDAFAFIGKEAINHFYFLEKRTILNLINGKVPNQTETKKCNIY